METGPVGLKVTKVADKETKEAVSIVPVDDKDIFKPTREQRKIKATFLSRIKGMPVILNSIEPEEVLLYCPEFALVKQYWSNPCFRNWFRNDIEERSRINYLLGRQLDNIEDILENTDGTQSVSSILSAGKQLMELKKMFDDADKSVPAAMTGEDDLVKKLASQMHSIKQKADMELEKRRARPATLTGIKPMLPE